MPTPPLPVPGVGAAARKQSRPLNKAEQRLFARLYCASHLSHSDIELCLSEPEEDGVAEAYQQIVKNLSGNHPSRLGDVKQIENYIKSLR